ncbi:MAG: thioesterase family protein [Candidatus Omnitrophota bacterium]
MSINKTNIRVRYEETDRMGVVYYSKYLVWFEIGRTELFRQRGLSYRDLEEKNGVRLMVVSVNCAYKLPVTYDDLITIETHIPKIRNSSMVFSYNIFRDTSLVATGESTHVFTDKNGKPIKIYPEVREALATAQA